MPLPPEMISRRRAAPYPPVVAPDVGQGLLEHAV